MTGAGYVAIEVVLVVLSVPVLCCTTYLMVLAVCSRRRPPPAYPQQPSTRFTFVVPAHDEASGIVQTIASLRAVDYPSELFSVLVVADNCTDATAVLAQDAGATVVVRENAEKRGKGYALERAFEHCLSEGLVGAVVVVDADTVVSHNLLRAFAARFDVGALAVQADYGVRNAGASWRTRLMVIALALFHVLRSLGRESLGVSTGLRGNGMGLSTKLLREVPHDAYSVVEDLEYGIRLGMSGHRVHYVHEAHVFGEMVSSERASRSQRTRWEAGRFAIARTHLLSLLRRALVERSALLLDLALDVMVPPLTYVVAVVVLGTLASIAASVWAVRHAVLPFAWIPWSVSLVFIGSYVARGLVLADMGWAGVRALAWAPFYMAWKMALAAKQTRVAKGEWIRTAREKKG